jgi:hypothetical protein
LRVCVDRAIEQRSASDRIGFSCCLFTVYISDNERDRRQFGVLFADLLIGRERLVVLATVAKLVSRGNGLQHVLIERPGDRAGIVRKNESHRRRRGHANRRLCRNGREAGRLDDKRPRPGSQANHSPAPLVVS